MSFFGKIFGGNSSSDKMANSYNNTPWLTDKGRVAMGYSNAVPASVPASDPAAQQAAAQQAAAQQAAAQQAAAQQAAAQQAAAQQAAAAESQRQAIINSQRSEANKLMLQGEEYAKKSLGLANVAQQAKNQQIISSQSPAQSKPISIGGSMDINPMQMSLQQAGAAPAMAAAQSNFGTGGTQQRLNQFASPSARGLSFGGS